MAKGARPEAGRVVYSSELGRVCSTCTRPVAQCTCREAARVAQRPPGDGVARVRRESKGRGGKTVTTVSGLPLDDAAIEALAVQLKKRCGVGGAVKDWVIIVQGDHVETVMAELGAAGIKAKRAGG
jgi:translation initiation factor 1